LELLVLKLGQQMLEFKFELQLLPSIILHKSILLLLLLGLQPTIVFLLKSNFLVQQLEQ